MVVVAQLVTLGRQAIDTLSISERAMTYFEESQFVSLETQAQDDILLVVLTVRTDSTIAPEQVAQAQAELQDVMGRNIALEVAYVPVVRANSVVVPEVVPEVTPEMTPEAMPDMMPEATTETSP
jgi:hypothetical protein